MSREFLDKMAAEIGAPKAPPGPWDDEPDYVRWRHRRTGYDVLMRRGALGAWCGYVRVPPEHPLSGAGYDGVAYGWAGSTSVHGGITFFGEPEGRKGTGERWIGFDCGHYCDAMPLLPGAPGAVYRTAAYARRQCNRLARALYDARTAGTP